MELDTELIDGLPVRILGFHDDEYLVSDGTKEWWIDKGFVRI
jgi:hypothetical protein